MKYKAKLIQCQSNFIKVLKHFQDYFHEIGLDFGTESQNVNKQCYTMNIFVQFDVISGVFHDES